MAVDDVSTVRVIGRYQSQNIVNTLHYKHTAQDTDEEAILAVLCAAWEAELKTNWLAAHIDTYDLVGLRSFRQAGAPKIPAIRTITGSGAIDDAELPAYVCRTITLYTASTNHRRRGRVMLSGSGQAMFNAADGGVASANLVILQTLGATLELPIVLGDDAFQLVLPSTDVLPVEPVIATAARPTPSSVTTRRIRQYLVG